MKAQGLLRWGVTICVAIVVTAVTTVTAAMAATTDTAATPAAGTPSVMAAAERLGTVSFATSCAPKVQADINRGVALLHDFWYEESRPQFERILKADPSCAIAHWGLAMSGFFQLWARPDDAGMAAGWKEMQAARAPAAKTARERQYIAALSEFFKPGKAGYEPRIEAYAASMGKLYAQYPDDVDAGAFYALALLAATQPDDTSLTQPRKAMAVLTPLWRKYPDHPGLVHYIIHACDNPSMAPDGLAAARHYGKIAPSGPHAVHMPGHIFARLGLWQEDIESNVASVEASRVAQSRHESGWMDQFHSDDFLVYAYLQSGQEAQARSAAAASSAAISHYESMPGMTAGNFMVGMFPYYRVKLPAFIALETRDWKSVAELDDSKGTQDSKLLVYWARAIAHGHLREAREARGDLVDHIGSRTKSSPSRRASFAATTKSESPEIKIS